MNHNTQIYRFEVPGKQALNIPVGYHISIIETIDGEKVKREYTPTADKKGYFELTVKNYRTYGISEHLACLEVGQSMSMRGPYGNWEYKSSLYSRLCMYCAGTGLTPMYQILTTVSRDGGPKCSMIYCNKKAQDILFKKN